MKTPSHKLAAFCAAAIMASATFRTSADDAGSTAPAGQAVHPDRTCTGIITTVDTREQTVKLQDWAMFHRSFNLGSSCSYMLPGNLTGTINDLRPGEKVTVSYQRVQGVLIADRVIQIPVTIEGKVVSVDPMANKMVVHERGHDKQLFIATGCKVVLLKQQPGSIADIRVGDHVTVTYETPNDTATARQIAQTSNEYVGTVTAIDTIDRTVKAHATFDDKKFVIGDDCAIVLAGRPNARLDDLKPDDKLTFSYDEINGVNVVNRIGTLPPSSPNSKVVYATPHTGAGY
jgi:hypothetical protein